MRPSARQLALLAALLQTISVSAGADWFVDVARQTGLDFLHFNGMSGDLLYLEVVGSGVALFDYDSDGDLDVYLIQGRMLGAEKTLADATFPPPPGLVLTDRLYRNDLGLDADGLPVLRFVDVTESSRIDAPGYGMGAVTGDFDNDGWTDLYVTNFGPNQMWRNNGDGTFADATESSATNDIRWSVPATFFDYDRDGWLDLFVGNYLKFRVTSEQGCFTETGTPQYCGPLAYSSDADRLFHNLGDGTFRKVTESTGLGSAPPGAALGAVAADLNGDSWLDLYVANDMMPNNLWINQGDRSFLDDALFAGCAVNADGQPEASMGVDAGDFDGDGDLDLFMAHFAGETNTLFLNDGTGVFRDQTGSVGLGGPSWEFTAFGTAWFDYDNDGLLDLLTVNGTVNFIEELVLEGDPFPLHQINQLFRNQGDGSFIEVTDQAGSAFELSEVSRGSAFGDLDNDGDTDVVISNNSGPVRLLLNQVGQDSGWVGLRLLGDSSVGHRDLLGSRAAITPGNGDPLWRQVKTDGSYASSNDPRILVGLGTGDIVSEVRAFWPDGSQSRWTGVPSGALVVLLQSPARSER